MTATPVTHDETTDSNTITNTHISNPRLLRNLRLGWIAIVLLVIGIFVAALPNEYFYLRDSQRWGMGYQSALTEIGLSRDFLAAFITVCEILLAVYMLSMGIFIFQRRSDDWIALLVSLTLIFAMVSGTFVVNDVSSLLGAIIRTTGILMFIALMFLFPDGRFVPHWTRWLLLLAVPLCTIFIPFQIELFTGNVSQNTSLALILIALIIVIMFVGMAVQTYRYRNILTRIQQQQTKWVILGFGTAIMGTLIVLASQVFFPLVSIPILLPQGVTYSRSSLLAIFILFPFFYLANALAPLAISFSMIRYRLWDVDVVLNRSLVYGAVTVLLVVIFAGIVAVISAVTQGQAAGIGAIVAAVVATALFNPTRKRVQSFVDRRIYGLNFDLNQLAAAQKLPDIKKSGALSGRKLGGYDVLDVIGKGGMGEVYKGQADGQTVALKILPNDLAQQDEFRQRFEREGQALTALAHPNIVKMISSGSSEGIAYLAMEYIEGDDLSWKLKLQGALSMDETCDILKGLASALDYAHQHGFIHRDIKPSNVMLRRNKDGETSEAVLMDFGVAKVREAHTGITGTGAIGTIGYMAPEQIMAAKAVDQRADIYALGVMTYEMLTGELPFKGGPAQVMFAHLQQPPPDPRDLNDNLPSPAAHAILRALAKQPNERFASAGEFAASLG